MKDWIRRAAMAVKADRDIRRSNEQRAHRKAEAIRIEMPRIWQSLTENVQEAVRLFDEEMGDDRGRVPHMATVESRASDILVITMAQNRGAMPMTVTLRYKPEEQSVSCDVYSPTQMKSSPPKLLYFKADDAYMVGLAYNEHFLDVLGATQAVLEPVFNAVQLEII